MIKILLYLSYPFENATHWRMRAEKMRTLAEEASNFDPTVRAMMLRIAADYDRLAERAAEWRHPTIPSYLEWRIR